MTATQKETHVAELENLLKKAGATKDRWGMFHIGERKFDTRKNNLKIYLNKTKVKSEPLTKINLVWFEGYLKQIKKL